MNRDTGEDRAVTMNESKIDTPLDPDDLQRVENSYFNFYTNSEFYDTFYDIFIQQSQEIRDTFRGIDMDAQKKVLRDGLTFLIGYSKGKKFATEKIRKLGKNHSRDKINVPFYLYAIWVESFLTAAEQYDPEFSEATKASWKQALVKGIDLMLKYY